MAITESEHPRSATTGHSTHNADYELPVNGWFAGPVEHRTSSSVRLQCRRTRPSAGGPARRGELWFAAHSRAAPEEMTTLSRDLQDVVHRTGHPAPALDALLSPAAIGRTAVWRLRSRQARLPVTGRAGRCGRRGGRSWRSCAPWWWPGWWCSTRQGCSPWARRGSSKDPGSAIGFTVLLLLGAESGSRPADFWFAVTGLNSRPGPYAIE